MESTNANRKYKKIPKPDFIVLYNGDDEYPDKSEMKLSDAFEDVDIPDMLELTVRVYPRHATSNGWLKFSVAVCFADFRKIQ